MSILKRTTKIIRSKSLHKIKRVAAASLLTLTALLTTAQAQEHFHFQLKPQPLVEALLKFSKMTETVVTVPSHLLVGKTSAEVKGTMSAKDALIYLLKNTNLNVIERPDGILIIRTTRKPNYKKIGFTTDEEFDAALGVYEGDENIDAISSMQLEEIIVVARKRSENLQNVPIAITAITSDVIQKISAADLSDISLISTSASITKDGFVTIRGVGDFARNIGSGARAAVYIDGVLAGRSYAFNQNLLDVERVEILRGPQGTLFGKNSVSGAINIVTKKPHDTFEGHVAVEYGNFNHTQLEANLNTPLAKDKIFLSIQGSYLYEDGYLYNSLLDQRLNGRDRYSIRAKILFQLSDATDIILSGDYLEESTKFTEDLAQADADFGGHDEAPEVFELRHNTDEYNDFEYKGASLTLNHDFDNEHSLTSITAYRENSFENLIEEDLSSVDGAASLFNEISDQLSQEIRLSSPADETFDYVIGAFYLKQNFVTSRSALVGTAIGGPFAIVTPGEVSDKSLSGFFHANYRPIETLELSAGLRYTHQTKELLYSSRDPSGAFFLNFTDFSDKRTDTVLSPKFTVKYTVDDNSTLYATYSKAFKSGGWNADFITTLNQIAFDPEYATNYELGLKTTMFNDSVQLNVAVFLTKFNDFQVSRFVQIPDQGTTIVIDNAGKVTSKGFEIEAKAILAENLSLTTNYTFNDAYYSEYKDADGLGAHFDGNDLGLSAKHNAYIALDHSIVVNADYSLEIHSDYSYRGRQFTDAQNSELDEISAVSLFNAQMSLFHDASGLQITLWAKNIFDKTVFGGKSTSFLGVVRDLPQKPRSFGAKLKYNF